MWNVKWTYQAEIQLEDILNFWIKHNNSYTYSQKILNEVANSVELISANPYIAQEREQENLKIRQFIILKNFSMIYRITDMVEIIAFWDNRQDPDKLARFLTKE